MIEGKRRNFSLLDPTPLFHFSVFACFCFRFVLPQVSNNSSSVTDLAALLCTWLSCVVTHVKGFLDSITVADLYFSQRKPSYVIEGKCKHHTGRITCRQLMLWEQVGTLSCYVTHFSTLKEGNFTR